MLGVKFDLSYQTKEEEKALAYFRQVGVTPKLYDEIPGKHYYAFSKKDMQKLRVDLISDNRGFRYPNGGFQVLWKIDPDRAIKEYRRGFTYIYSARMINNKMIEGNVSLTLTSPSTEVKMFTLEEYLDVNFEGYKEYGLTESKNFYILTVFQKGNQVTTILYDKFDNNKLGGLISQKVNNLYLTEKQIREKEAKKKAKECEEDREIYAVRGDGSVTTLDRLLRNEPDLAPPGTGPTLNI
jgi:hypothetical protein